MASRWHHRLVPGVAGGEPPGRAHQGSQERERSYTSGAHATGSLSPFEWDGGEAVKEMFHKQYTVGFFTKTLILLDGGLIFVACVHYIVDKVL